MLGKSLGSYKDVGMAATQIARDFRFSFAWAADVFLFHASVDYPSPSQFTPRANITITTVTTYEMSQDRSHMMVTHPWSLNLANATPNDGTARDELTPAHAEGPATESDTSEDYDEQCDLCGSLNIDTLVSDYGPPGKLYDLGMVIDCAFTLQDVRRNLPLASASRGQWCGLQQ
jgi:hypothetical protein